MTWPDDAYYDGEWTLNRVFKIYKGKWIRKI
jgi:hypothetical protein